MPKALREYLFAIAPVIEGCFLEEAVVNRYRIGDYMPEHIDLAQYQYNFVIALCGKGDGVEVEGVFVEDDPGYATIFSRKSEPHEVPVVKHLRYILIYLYA